MCGLNGDFIRDVKDCIVGPLIKMPQTSEDIRKLVEMVEEKWREEGDK